VTVEEMKLVVLGWSAKEQLLDKDVYNDKNQDIGDIEDIIISPKKTVSWAIIGVGEFLGIAEKKVAIPMGQLELKAGKPILRMMRRSHRPRSRGQRNGGPPAWWPSAHAGWRGFLLVDLYEAGWSLERNAS
jgi:sporulation protein YlmC with PRC-barrel domain